MWYKLNQINTMKSILKTYTSNREYSVQETISHILQELHLRRALPGVQFVNTNLLEKYGILDYFCFSEFTAYCSLIYKRKETIEGDEYQPDHLPNSSIETNHENLNCPKIINLMNSNERMQCWKGRRVPNKYRFSNKYTHH